MQKRISKLLLLVCSILLLSGCWDQKEIEKRAYVVAIGFDKAKNEGQVKISYLIANPEVGSQQQGGASNEPSEEVISFETNDLISALAVANSVIAKEITYDLLGALVVSEEFAKDPDFIRWIYDATKEREVRRDVTVIVSKEDASKFLRKNKPKLEARPHEYFELILERGAETGRIPDSDLHLFLKITEADADLFLAPYATTEKTKLEEKDPDDEYLAGELKVEGQTNATQFAGSAVFKEGQMIGTITGEETIISVLLSDTLKASEIFTTYPDPFNEKYRITTKISKKKKTDVQLTLTGKPRIDVKVPVTMEILTDHNMTNYAGDKEKRETLKKYLEERSSAKLTAFVKKTQEEFQGEPFGWSLHARKKFLTIPEYKNFDWMKTYPKMDVNISVEIRFGEFGRQSEVPDLKKMRD